MPTTRVSKPSIGRGSYEGTDIVEGKPEGLALDMNQSRPIEGFETQVVGIGGGSYEGTEGSDVVVITAGIPRKPGMSRPGPSPGSSGTAWPAARARSSRRGGWTRR